MNNQELFDLYDTLNYALSFIFAEMRKRNIPWKTYADAGLRVKAMQRYHEQNGGDLLTARNVVDEYLKSK